MHSSAVVPQLPYIYFTTSVFRVGTQHAIIPRALKSTTTIQYSKQFSESDTVKISIVWEEIKINLIK